MGRLLGKRKDADFCAWYDDDRFCGMTFTFQKGDMVFLLYLAVDDAIRSRGYGSQILRELRERYKGCAFLLNVEPPDPGAEDHAQRCRRVAFYSRNGLVPTGYILQDADKIYWILGSEGHLARDPYLRLLRSLSFHLYRGKIQKAPEEDSLIK